MTSDPLRATCPVDRCEWELDVTTAPGEPCGFLREMAQHFDDVFTEVRHFILSEHLRTHDPDEYLDTICRLRQELLDVQREMA